MITARSVKTFFIGLFLTYLAAAIPHLWVKNNSIVSPILKPIDALEKVKPQLETKTQSFQLKKTLLPTAFAEGDFEQASGYAVTDLDNGQILLEKNMSKKLPIASLTKVMTAVVALDLAQPGEKFSVSEKAASQIPTKVMLKQGEEYSLDTLLNFMLISSANDSAEVIKEGIDKKYGEGTFIKAMNFKSKLIGLKNSHFTNTKGYDGNSHYSSAGDLSMLSAYALKEYPQIREIVSKEYADLTGGYDFRFYLNNWNGLLGVYPGVYGVKTGNTGQAGHTMIVVSEREGKKVLVVLLGAPGVLERDLWTAQLLNLGFEKLAGLEPVQITEEQLRNKYASWKYF